MASPLLNPEVGDGLQVFRLRPLQLVKVLVHDDDEPRRAGLALCVGRLADHNRRRKSECRESRLQVGGELARSGINVVADLLEILRRSGEVRQIFSVRSDQE